MLNQVRHKDILCLIKHHTMKMCGGSVDITSRILDIHTRGM